MRRRLLATILALALLSGGAGCGAGADDPPSAAPPPDTCDPAPAAAFRAWGEAGFSGSIALTTDGEPDCLFSHGSADVATATPNTEDTVFSIGSIAKAVTAAAVLTLVDDGTVALDDTAGDLVAGLRGPAADATVEQLLTHTSGLTGSHGEDHEPLSRRQAVAAIGALERAAPAGTEFVYSNAGYTLLALIVEAVADTSFRELVAARILRLPDGTVAGGFWDGEPAAPRPRATGYLDGGAEGAAGEFAGPHWALDGNGGLAMTMPQLAAWTEALFTGDILSPASTALVAEPGFDRGDGSAETPGWVAYDAEAFGEPVRATAGGGDDIGHNAVAVWLPDSERVVTMASNTQDVTAEDLLLAVAPALVAGDPLPVPPPPAVDLPSDVLAALAGEYELDTGGRLTVTPDGGGVAIVATGADAVAALFDPSQQVPDEEIAAHEAGVLALLAGETRAGRVERRALEADLGPIRRVEPAGTVYEDRELRTYVTIISDTGATLLWYALDDGGAVAAAETAASPPSMRLAGSEDGTFHPDDPTAVGAGAEVSFEGDTLTITAASRDTVAHRAP